jgi:hypothetical protein
MVADLKQRACHPGRGKAAAAVSRMAAVRYGEAGPGPKGSLMSAILSLDGQELMFVSCETQAEVDECWKKLSAGGREVQCGWLTDKFGVSWQVIPSILGKLLADKDPAKAGRVMRAMMKMVKIDISALEEAARG